MGLNSCFVEVLPYAAMLMTDCVSVSIGTMSKAGMSRGMSHFVFVFYANSWAFLLTSPVCFIFERTKWAPLRFSLICKICLISLLGVAIGPNCNYAGIDYSSPTLGFATRTLIPAFTFLLAVILRMEKLKLRSWTSQGKIIATLSTIFGALVLILYKGPPIGSLSNVLSKGSNWVVGGLLLATSALCHSIWVTGQGLILKEHTSEITSLASCLLFGSIQCGVVALVAEGNHPNAWKVRLDVELLPVICKGVFASFVSSFVEIWCVKKKGPLFVAMFKPPGIVIAAASNFIFLGERLHIRTIVGSVIVITGFYGVIWAKSKENEHHDLAQEKTPLLQNDTYIIP